MELKMIEGKTSNMRDQRDVVMINDGRKISSGCTTTSSILVVMVTVLFVSPVSLKTHRAHLGHVTDVEVRTP